MKEYSQKTKKLARTIQESGRNQKVGFVDNRNLNAVSSILPISQYKRLQSAYRTRDPSYREVSDLKKSLRKVAYSSSDEHTHPAHGSGLEKTRDRHKSQQESHDLLYGQSAARKIRELDSQIEKETNGDKIAQL